MNYYNDFDPHAAQWLRNLIEADAIPPGFVDTRSIEDVTPNELAGYTQCHFFAGIGGWVYALDLAGWPRDRPVWTGSCPCQPFSAAGKGAGFADERHLWPAWQHLIAQCRPPVIFGEQVASKAVEPWIDLVQADMEGMGYAFGCVPFPAAGVGAPHIRDRNYWVAHADRDGCTTRREIRPVCEELHAQHGGAESRMADTDRGQQSGEPVIRGTERDWENTGWQEGCGEPEPSCEHGGLADPASSGRREEHADAGRGDVRDRAQEVAAGLVHGGSDYRPGPTNGQWGATDWLLCRDGKWRPVEPGAQQMVDGLSRAVGLLRADNAAKEEIANATKATGLAAQVLRAVQCGHGASAIWWSLGGCVGLPEATLLLAGLCEQSRKLGRFFNGEAPGSAQVREGGLRAMRGSEPEVACPPPGREPRQQLAWELGDALPKLSQVCPLAGRHLDQLRQFTGFPLAHGVPGRVGLLRGYGNAIVPQAAAEFVIAFMQSTRAA